MEQIATYFSNNGVPASWLNPTITIAERNWTIRVTNGIVVEIPNMLWFYIYNFNEYNPEKQYLYLFDWGSTLSDSDRYIPWNNDLDSYSYKQSWWRTVAATIPYDDKWLKIKLDSIEKIVGQKPPKAEKIDLTKIEKRLKSIEEKKIEFPKPIDLAEVHKKIDSVAQAIKPWITPEQIDEVIQQREDNKALNELVNVHKPQIDAEVNALKQLIEISKQQKKQETLDRIAIKALSRIK